MMNLGSMLMERSYLCSVCKYNEGLSPNALLKGCKCPSISHFKHILGPTSRNCLNYRSLQQVGSPQLIFMTTTVYQPKFKASDNCVQLKLGCCNGKHSFVQHQVCSSRVIPIPFMCKIFTCLTTTRNIHAVVVMTTNRRLDCICKTEDSKSMKSLQHFCVLGTVLSFRLPTTSRIWTYLKESLEGLQSQLRIWSTYLIEQAKALHGMEKA